MTLRIRLQGLLAALAVAATLTGCGDDSAGSDVARQLATSMCDLAFDCCTTDERNLVLGHFVTEDTCVDRLVTSATIAPAAILDDLALLGAAAVLPNLRALDQAISRGRIGVDKDALEACVEYLSSLPCATALDDEEDEGCRPPEPVEDFPCDGRALFIGKVGEGGTCTSPANGLECAEGLTCRIDPNLGIEGVCIARGGLNDLCFNNSECQEELYCSRLTGLCSIPRAEGETCLYADPNDPSPPPSSIVIACEEGLRCDPITDRCVAPCQRGAACAGPSDCDEEQGFTCVMGRCDRPREAELPCAADADCAETLRCIDDPSFATRVCADPLGIGEACDPFSPNDPCASGYCATDTFTCAEPVDPGELCPTGDDAQCDGGYCETTVQFCIDDEGCLGSGSCNTAIGRCEFYCVEQRADGAVCDVDVECQSGSCVAETCRTLPLADGIACTSDFQCESLFCSPDEQVCERLPLSNGATCFANEQCASGICFQNSCNAGLTEGQSCTGALDPPCARDLFCNPDEPDPSCRPLHAAGQACDADYQCRGTCILRLGRFVCDGTQAPGVLMCEGP
jgi:hypothetical protein